MKYDVCREFGFETLINEVNSAIQNGWQPIGGIQQCWENGWYCQAMVMRPESPKAKK